MEHKIIKKVNNYKGKNRSFFNKVNYKKYIIK